MSDLITIGFTKMLSPTIKKDKWKSWLFNIGIRGSIRGETSYTSKSYNFSFSATKITKNNRIELYSSMYKRTSEFNIEDNETISSENTGKSLSGNYVYGLNDHWSIGGIIHTSSSSYLNKAFELKPKFGIEFNIFPYSESTKKQFIFQYLIGIQKTKYIETTIYDKDKETLFFHNLSGALSLKEKWGSAYFKLEGENYFHDFSKYSININSRVSWRIVKGISMNVSFGYSVIHDQLYLPKGNLSSEEILLRVSAIETSYHLWSSFGFQFTFGSIYNNVVNPRFD